ncbi:Meiotically up-regulated gene 154 protein [Colletotrichum sidae]|uniref:Meiotically up-regulated gene 154 protein n=1 Tax=Colletotrichum sidae TaxID=1347389 RepID=A0A4R8T7U6_9PEZI|nr:Meiotically up-regulated gene 154 protein [Colletotrichum sidae]
MPRLVRKKTLSERMKAFLNPMDFLLWLSEELESRDWDSKALGSQLGVGFNFAFLLSRANCMTSEAEDDVFNDAGSGGLVTFVVRPLVWILGVLSVANAFYAMTRTRQYRLFQVNVEDKPHTPSAQRVKAKSDPAASSPLRMLGSLIAPETAESRAHPDKVNDVWELSVWDPLPVSLQLFCLFSPGHVLVYMMFLPLVPLDPRPSVTVFNCVVLQLILSAQLLFVQSRYAQQIKDTAIIHKEVLHEYDTKFVRPRLHPVVRDVGTQCSPEEEEDEESFVELGTPTTVIKKEFVVTPNPHVRQDESVRTPPTGGFSSRLFTPVSSRRSEVWTPVPSARPVRQSLPSGYQSSSTSTANVTTTTVPTNFGGGGGGSLGVFNHAKSPLKKATSLNDVNQNFMSPRNSREMAAMEQRRGGSPLKQSETRRSTGSDALENTSSASYNPFASAKKNRYAQQQERYPSRWSGFH